MVQVSSSVELGIYIVKEGEGNFRRVLEAEENLMDKERGEGNAMKLKRGFHGVKWIVVFKQ